LILTAVGMEATCEQSWGRISKHNQSKSVILSKSFLLMAEIIKLII